MSHTPSRPADNWSPLYFLASVGAGGISVTFFMYLMHWVPHPGRTVPVFEDITAALGYLLDASAVTGQLFCVDGGQHLGWKTPDIVGVE